MSVREIPSNFRELPQKQIKPNKMTSHHNRYGVITMDNTTFPKTGFVRLSQILAPNGPIPVSKSTFWSGVKDGRFPKPQKLGPKTTVWLAKDIRALYENTNEE